jgi:hypothetical protein
MRDSMRSIGRRGCCWGLESKWSEAVSYQRSAVSKHKGSRSGERRRKISTCVVAGGRVYDLSIVAQVSVQRADANLGTGDT